VQPTVSTSPASIPGGGTVKVTWSTNGLSTSRDWLGLYLPGTSDTSHVAWMYVSCSKTPGSARASGSCLFTVPPSTKPGTYEFRLLPNGQYAPALATTNLTVTGESSVTVTATPNTIRRGGTFTATWNANGSPTSRDWLGLYLPGTSGTSHVAWMYVSCSKTPGSARASGSCPFTVPSSTTPGTYELRLMPNNQYMGIAKSNLIVTVK
jgi:hypothetical protein